MLLAGFELIHRFSRASRCLRRTPREAARQLLSVSRVLGAMHRDGYTHNDLHSGNVLQNSKAMRSKFSVIDMGATCKVGVCVRA